MLAGPAAVLLTGVAIGLDPFLALLSIALATLTDWPPLIDPVAAAALVSPVVISATAAFYALELLAERSQPTFIFWHVSQIPARPLIAALCAIVIAGAWLDDPAALPTTEAHAAAAPGAPWMWAMGAASLAFFTHALKVGATAIGWWSEPRPRFWVVSGSEDLVVLGLVAIAHAAPVPGAFVIVLTWVVALFVGRFLLRAAIFSFYLAWSRSWGSFRPFLWRSADALPKWARRLIETVASPFEHRVRVTPVGGFRVAGHFRRGWLTLASGTAALLVRGSPAILLSPDSVQAIAPSTLYTRVFLRGKGETTFMLVVPKNGPSAGTVAAELDAEAALVEPEPSFLRRVVA